MAYIDLIRQSEPKKEGREILFAAVHTVANARDDEYFTGMPARWMVRKLRHLAKTVLLQAGDAARHQELELAEVLEDVSQEGIDLDRGTIFQFTTTHEMPEEQNGGKPWQIDITDEFFLNWDEQLDRMVEGAGELLHHLEETAFRHESDFEFHGWTTHISDLVHSVTGNGHTLLHNALAKQGAIVLESWCDSDLGIAAVRFENAEGVHVFDRHGAHIVDSAAVGARLNIDEPSLQDLAMDARPQDRRAVEAVDVQFQRRGDTFTIAGRQPAQFVDVWWDLGEHRFSVSIYADHGEVYNYWSDTLYDRPYERDIRTIWQSGRGDGQPVLKTVEQVQEIIAPFAGLSGFTARQLNRMRQARETARASLNGRGKMREVMRLLFSDNDAVDLWWRRLPDHEWLNRFTFNFHGDGEVVIWEKN